MALGDTVRITVVLAFLATSGCVGSPAHLERADERSIAMVSDYDLCNSLWIGLSNRVVKDEAIRKRGLITEAEFAKVETLRFPTIGMSRCGMLSATTRYTRRVRNSGATEIWKADLGDTTFLGIPDPGHYLITVERGVVTAISCYPVKREHASRECVNHLAE